MIKTLKYQNTLCRILYKVIKRSKSTNRRGFTKCVNKADCILLLAILTVIDVAPSFCSYALNSLPGCRKPTLVPTFNNYYTIFLKLPE